MAKRDGSRNKSPQSSSRPGEDVFKHYNEQVKESEQHDLKAEMLKLPIFQNLKGSQLEREEK